LFLVFDFSPLVLYTLGHKNNNNNNNNNNKAVLLQGNRAMPPLFFLI